MANSLNHGSDSTLVEHEAKIDEKNKSAFEKYLSEIKNKNEDGYAAVHLWNYVSPRYVGHLSLTLSDGTHISFWPDFNNKSCSNFFLRKKGKSKSLIKDMEEEKRIPDDTHFIPSAKLSIEKIKNWWKVKQSKRYGLFSRNCAYMVIKALMEGEFLIKQKIIENSILNEEFKGHTRLEEGFEGAEYEHLKDKLLKEYESIRDSIEKEEPNWPESHMPSRTFYWIKECNEFLFPNIKHIDINIE
jgi:hypothetical protein